MAKIIKMKQYTNIHQKILQLAALANSYKLQIEVLNDPQKLFINFINTDEPHKKRYHKNCPKCKQ